MNNKNKQENTTTQFELLPSKIIIQKCGSSTTIDDEGITINSESGKLHFLNQ